MSNNWAEAVRIDRGIDSIPLFKINIPLFSESIRLNFESIRAEVDDNVELGQVFGVIRQKCGQDFSRNSGCT